MSTDKALSKNLPDWDKSDEKVLMGKATPLEIFIVHNEPAGIEKSKVFREELSNLITYIQSFYDR
jgi:hypothetical protein